MLKKRVKNEQTYAQTNAVKASILDSLFITELKIPSDNIDDFMYFCEVDSEFQQLVDLEDQLKLWEYLVLKSERYRDNNGLE